MPIVKIFNRKNSTKVDIEKIFSILENGFGVSRDKVKIIFISADEVRPPEVFIEIQAISHPDRTPPSATKDFKEIREITGRIRISKAPHTA